MIWSLLHDISYKLSWQLHREHRLEAFFLTQNIRELIQYKYIVLSVWEISLLI